MSSFDHFHLFPFLKFQLYHHLFLKTDYEIHSTAPASVFSLKIRQVYNYGTAGLIIDNDIDIEVNTGYFDTDIVNGI